MKIQLAFITLLFSLMACKPSHTAYNDIKIAGAMKNVMWHGKLAGIINIDTISDKTGLYGIGPLAYLRGEILINNGTAYVSKVISKTEMQVEENTKIEAPFFVFGNVTKWEKYQLPDSVHNINSLENHLDYISKSFKGPFVFKLKGRIKSATIHIQNLPLGTMVSSPDQAHQGQVKYLLKNTDVEIIGFFSTEHQAVFTHHGSFTHMHLISDDKKEMGHLDEVEFISQKMDLFLPVE